MSGAPDGSEPAVAIEVPADDAAPLVVRRAIEDVVHDNPAVRLSESELAEVCSAVHEACTNIVRHGLRGDARRTFRAEVVCRAAELAIVFRDDGPAYRLGPLRAPAPEVLAERGYGIHIMRSWLDEVRLERIGACNVLSLVRRYRAAASCHA